MKPESRKVNQRCVIYTRVSSDSGLDQEFNSLDNQREAAEAYVKSQAHEGWRLIRDRYDDGGFSGGSMERPALRTLLDEVRQGGIDIIVVYKVDRLTRSLADFAKLVELFDEHDVSFVSVTQAFNTTTSMGRLTLNVLLSFAQFEREVTGERIRDKIAASKKKGIWMGGVVPLGYRVENRALHIVEDHAAIVRQIFLRYLALGSVVRLKPALDGDGIRLPVRIDGAGRQTGGGLFSRGHLYKILANPVYIGRLAHKGQDYPGQHSAIVDQETWDRTQALLTSHALPRQNPTRSTDALLTGKLFDDRGFLMSPSEAARGSKRWRYYVSQAIQQGRQQDAGSHPRISAPPIESAVLEAIRAATPERRLSEAAIQAGLEKVVVGKSRLTIRWRDAQNLDGPALDLSPPWSPAPTRREREILQGDGAPPSAVRPMRVEARRAFASAYGKARTWLDLLIGDPRTSVQDLADREQRTERSIRQTLSLAFLDPALVAAALQGRLPRGFGLKRMMDLPADWREQWIALGLQPSRR
jgi:site-specific DNA recombinase